MKKSITTVIFLFSLLCSSCSPNSTQIQNNSEIMGTDTVEIPFRVKIQTSTITPLQVPTTFPPQNHIFPLIIDQAYWRGEIFLFNPNTGELQELFGEQDMNYELIGWSPGGKDILIVPFRENSSSIFHLDLDGDITGDFFTYAFSNLPGQIESFFPSPQFDWLAFTAFTDACNVHNIEREPIVFDVFTVNTREPNKIHRLSNNCACWECWQIKWSADGSWLAYLDLDSDNIQQLFISRPDQSETIQLTNFENPSNIIDEIQWSASNSLAFSYYYKQENALGDYEYVNAFSIVPDITDISIQSLIKFKVDQKITEFWWQGDNILGTLIKTTNDSSDLVGLYWYDSSSGDLIYQAFEQTVSNENQYPQDIVPIGDSIGFFTNDSFIIYNPKTNKYHLIVQADNEFEFLMYFQNWIANPNSDFYSVTQ